jgi:hypothetical protein
MKACHAVSFLFSALVVLAANCSYAMNAEIAEVVENPVGPEASVRLILLADMEGTPRAGCTGSFISDSVVLTAAHCISRAYQLSSKPIFIDSETGVRATTFQTFCTASAPSSCADIALISFPTGTYRGPTWLLDLFVPRLDHPVSVTAYGYGTYDDLHSKSDWQLRRSTGLVEIGATEISNARRIFGVQNGDSGGPLVNGKGHIIGVFSNFSSLFSNETWAKLWLPEESAARDIQLQHALHLAHEFELKRVKCTCTEVRFERKKKWFSGDQYNQELSRSQVAYELPFASDASTCSVLQERASYKNNYVQTESCD